MAIKQELKTSEARILVLLNQVDDKCRYTGAIAAKLDMDYSYTIHILNVMNDKGWLSTKSVGIKMHHFLTKKAPLNAAKKLLGGK